MRLIECGKKLNHFMMLYIVARAKLNDYYGDDIVSNSGALPVHLLGNMWGQTWSNIYDIIYSEGSNQIL